jgi:uncharacterized membrane protein YagU involved in acid resistance
MDLILRALLAGFVGAFAMTLAGWLLRVAGLPSFDFGELIATKLLHMATDQRTRLGTLLHFAVGITLAFVYALIFHVALRNVVTVNEWAKGAVYGVVLWLGMMLVVLPALGEGGFGSRLGGAVAPVTLVMHLIYGAVLAESYVLG